MEVRKVLREGLDVEVLRMRVEGDGEEEGEEEEGL